MSARDEVCEVLARYVRAADRRDGVAMAQLFLPEGRVEILHRDAGVLEPLASLVGREAIVTAVGTMMKAHPAGGWSHHTTHDPLVAITGDVAELDAQFVVFEVRAARGGGGAITTVEVGYYRLVLRRVDGEWRIASNRIEHDFRPS